MTMTIEQVADIFRQEEASGRKAESFSDVPNTYNGITESWLTAVLCRGISGAEVINFRIADFSNGSSNRARIYLRYNDVGRKAGLPATVFCKGSMTEINRKLLATNGAGEGEVNFFNKVRHRLSIEAPIPIHAALNPDTLAYIVVMKDMGKPGDFCQLHTRIDLNMARGMVTTLARLHAPFYGSPELGTDSLPFATWHEWWRRNIDEGNPGFVEFCDLGFAAAEDVIPPSVFKRRAEIWPATEACVARHAELPLGLMHSDVHLGNWYIGANGEMGLTDWQVINCGHWSRDFAYAITTALEIEDRRAWFPDLLAYYLDRMQAFGAPKIDFDEAMLNVRQQLLAALAFWTITLRPATGMPDMQPEALSVELIRRITAAMEDYDALDAFG
jgi:Phosphotransferase enzyme family